MLSGPANVVSLRSTKALVALLVAACVAASCTPPKPETPEVTPQPAPSWENTLEKVVPCVVTLRMTLTRSFDTETAKSSGGTGFIVDKERGLVLTNRHLMTPGPVVAEAIFGNKEEVELTPVYRDPVHDFAFYRFDPKAVQFQELCELPLVPEAIKVGIDIRVIGNDAGEQVSILSGTMARLDRMAPSYGRGEYNDFNTFYYQAASSTSGGSSGSPVVDIHGQVVALNAGASRNAASSFYLPLDRAVRALAHIQEGTPITRGGLHTIFGYEPFNELRRLNLDAVTEESVRQNHPDTDGMLVASQVILGGAADGKLQAGDILLSIQGQDVVNFFRLDELLDENVGQTVLVEVERGGERRSVELVVADLNASMPSEYVDFSRAVVHPVSLQMARSYNLPLEGLIVTRTGYMLNAAGMDSTSMLLSIDGEPMTNLDQLWDVLNRHRDGDKLSVRYRKIEPPQTENTVVAKLDRKWFPIERCRRDDAAGTWICVDGQDPPPDLDSASLDAVPARALLKASSTRSKRVDQIAKSLVAVDFDVPYKVEGVWSSNFSGTGLIIDAKKGLVLVDRSTAPITLGDVELTFGNILRIPGHVEFVHPLHNLAVVSYDPAALGDSNDFVSAVFSPRALGEGDESLFVGLDARDQVVSLETKVERFRPINLGFNTTRPEFRDTNLDVLSLTDTTPSKGGVLIDEKGRVQAFWGFFHNFSGGKDGSITRAIPSDVILPIVERLEATEPVAIRTLGIEFNANTLVDARDQGLSDEWVQRVLDKDPERLQVLSVVRSDRNSDAFDLLEGGDIVLSVDSQVVTRFIDVERAIQGKDEVEVELLRDRTVLTVELRTVELADRGVERVLYWSGALLHEPHYEVGYSHGLERRGVYVALSWKGGPAWRFDLSPTDRIVAMNGIPTPDLDAFVAAIEGLEDKASVRLETIDLSDQTDMETLKLDLTFWPTMEIENGPDGWTRSEIALAGR